MNVNAISLYAPKNNYNIHYGSKNKSTELPYNMLLQNKDLAKPENYKAYYGVTFKGYKCNPSNFQIKKAYGLECPCCGQMMITEAQIDAFKLRAKNKTGDELKEELLRYYEYYRPNESSIVDIIIEGAEKDEDADLQTIVKNQAQNSKRILEAEQKIVLSDIKRRAVYLTKGRRDKIMDAVDNAFELIEDSNDNFFFKNKEFKDTMYSICGNCKGKDKQACNKILSDLEKLPKSWNSKDAFFVKFSRKTNEEIASRLLIPALVTTEHIRPQSKNGENNTNNYIPLCGECNSKRGNTPYKEWFKVHPEMPVNLQKYLIKAQELIDKKAFSDSELYDGYVDDIIMAVRKETDGEIVLKKPDIKGNPSDTDIKKAVAPKSIDEIRLDMLEEAKSLQVELNDLNRVKKELQNDEEYINIVKYLKLLEQLKAAEINASNSKRAFEEAMRKKNATLAVYEKVLSDENSTPQQIKQKEKRKNLAIENYNAKKAENKTCARKSHEIRSKINEIRKKIRTLSVIEADLSALKKKIDELTDTKIEVNMLKESITDEPDLCLELEKLHYLINEKRAELDCDYDNDDYDDLKSQNIVDSYRLYKAQQALLENIDKERFNSFFAKDNIDISPEFIIDDSKQATKERLSSARADGAVIRQIKKDELDELLRKEDMILKKLRRIEESKDKIFASKHSLSTLDILKRRFSETEKQKAELDFKYRYADIDDRIKRIKQKIDDLYQQYAESYETNNQDSYDRVGTSSSSSS